LALDVADFSDTHAHGSEIHGNGTTEPNTGNVAALTIERMGRSLTAGRAFEHSSRLDQSSCARFFDDSSGAPEAFQIRATVHPMPTNEIKMLLLT
jgi:hypothetical protein